MLSAKRFITIASLISAIALPAAGQRSLSEFFSRNLCNHDSIDFAEIVSRKSEVIPLIDRPDFDSIISVPTRKYNLATSEFYVPAVYDTYELLDSVPLAAPDRGEFASAFEWLDDYNASFALLNRARQNYIFRNPELIRYNVAKLPEPPKSYRAFVDPVTTSIVVEEIKPTNEVEKLEINPDIVYKKWIHEFNASLQFSQAYVSPNWYQGGNNNLNLIGQASYHVKLNQQFHPKVLFETTVSYKLALNSAPDDSIHTINLTEDVFQVNSTFGLKAAKRWYYSANLMFKTQVFNSYPTNSRNLRSAFMSPGELNVGLGMTYNYESPKKSFNLGASISPLSWNLKTCTNSELNPANYGIEPGKHSVNNFGSSAEVRYMWKIAYNIVYNSRVFAFTDYEKFQADWEHTVDFNINKFLSTRFYLYMRYDTRTPRPADSDKWHKFQLKEIFSFGFSYHFGV